MRILDLKDRTANEISLQKIPQVVNFVLLRCDAVWSRRKRIRDTNFLHLQDRTSNLLKLYPSPNISDGLNLRRNGREMGHTKFALKIVLDKRKRTGYSDDNKRNIEKYYKYGAD